MIATLTIKKSKPRKDGSIGIDFTQKRAGGWEGGGTFGYLFPVGDYYVLMRHTLAPQGVFTSIEDFINRFEMETGITPAVV